VNFPDWSQLDGKAADDQRLVFTELDLNPLPVAYELLDDGYFFRGDYHSRRRKPGSDVDVCFSGRIAVTEIRSSGENG
jgi:5'-nucleotidase